MGITIDELTPTQKCYMSGLGVRDIIIFHCFKNLLIRVREVEFEPLPSINPDLVCSFYSLNFL